MAAPTWVSTVATATGTAASCIFTLPASIAANDIIILQLYKENTAAITWPSGFTQLTTVATTTNVHQQAIAWKRMAGGESGTVTASWTGSVFRAGHTHRITGCATSGDPWGTNFATAIDNTVGSTLNMPAVSLASTPADSLLFWGATDFAGSTTVWTPPTGFTDRGGDIVMDGSSKDNTAGGATGSLVGSANIGSDTKTAFVGALSSPSQPIIVLPPRRP